jgi:hypothetical protein
MMQARFEEGVWQLQQSLHVLREELSEHQVSRPFPSWDRSILTEITYVTPVLVKRC